ncbi:MAG: cation:proton antiporter [Bacteriovoracaceae bacterium]|nr:cation:proton antiporter [Bacteriovoracaceae bacterium]
MEHIESTLVFLLCFFFVALAAKQFGRYFKIIRLPLITGFLFTGIIVGPYCLSLISIDAVNNLNFLAQLSLAFIAFAAGGELNFSELKNRVKSIKWITMGLVFCTFFIGSAAFFLLTDFIPFMQSMSVNARIAVSILGGSILVARSPSSAIAIIKELRASGPFVQTAMGVTVIMDVLVIVLFSINSSISDVLLTATSFNISFIFLLAVEILIMFALGCLIGKLLQFIISKPLHKWIKGGSILLIGYGIFVFSEKIRHYTANNFNVEIFLEPLLICMIGGCIVSNYGQHRDEFLNLLHDIGPTIYLIFFTLTGASINLTLIGTLWPVILLLFLIRIGAVFVGSFSGGVLAGDSMKHNLVGWMSYITQAGVGMGLAREVAEEFPEWGGAFATLLISIIVINQIVGPAFFKWVIFFVKEAHPRAKKTEKNIIHNVIVFGDDGQAVALARQLHSHHWQTKVVYFENDEMKDMIETPIELHKISSITLDELRSLGVGGAGAIVTMLSDEINYQICELVNKNFKNTNLIVRLKKRINLERFQDLDAMIVAQSTAMISLLDHFVRSPSLVSMLLDLEEDQDIIDLKIRNPYVSDKRLSELDIPPGILIISTHRAGKMLNIFDNFKFKMGDRLTIIGPSEELTKAESFFTTNHYVPMVIY